MRSLVRGVLNDSLKERKMKGFSDLVVMCKIVIGIFLVALTAYAHLPLGEKEFPANKGILMWAVPIYFVLDGVLMFIDKVVEARGTVIGRSKDVTVRYEFDENDLTYSLHFEKGEGHSSITRPIGELIKEDGKIEEDRVKEMANTGLGNFLKTD